MRSLYVCLVLLNITFFALGQGDSLPTQSLENIIVTANRLTHFSSGNKIQKIDSLWLRNAQNTNLADLLATHSQVFIKTYGVGSLATASLRGTGASHTAVLWNGFNLQNSMNGTVDFALIPVFFLENAHIQHGGAGALFGSGAIGGVIHLNSQNQLQQGIKANIHVNVGSFQQFQQGVKVRIGNKKMISGIKLFHQMAQNNFPFINTTKIAKPKEYQSNNAITQYGFLQENLFKISKNQQLDFQIWYLNATRQIPPTLTTGDSKASQQDESLRFTANWSLKKNKVTYFVRSAFFKEKLIYQNPDIQLIVLSKANTWIGEIETHAQLSPYQKLNVGLNQTYFHAETDGYRNGQVQNRTSLFFSYKINNPKDTWNMIASLRKELINNFFTPFTPSLGMEKVVGEHWIFRGNIARTYKIPTFNDLYWQEGGNPNLLPEYGWSGEVSMNYESKKLLNLNITFFNSLIDNWIAWIPDKQGKWAADNVLKVWSRGFEISLKSNWTWGNWHFQPQIMYNYIISTNERVSVGEESSLYQQLIYVPKHTAQANMRIKYKNLQIIYNQIFTGERFVTSDNTQSLPFFALANLSIVQKIKRFHFQFQINNLWNKDYQQIIFRQMPMRNWAFTLNYNL
jgi:iron complex outermembrane receptor protein